MTLAGIRRMPHLSVGPGTMKKGGTHVTQGKARAHHGQLTVDLGQPMKVGRTVIVMNAFDQLQHTSPT